MIKKSFTAKQDPITNIQPQNDDKKLGFELIWYYWYLKYFANKHTSNNLTL